MSRRRRKRTSDGEAWAALFAVLFLFALIYAAVRAVVLFVIALWPLWACLTLCLTAWALARLVQARANPLKVKVIREHDEVAFTIRRRPWARGFPDEALTDPRAVIDPGGRFATVRWFNPRTEDESRLAQCLSDTQDTVAIWTYRMKGGKDDVDKAVAIASKLATRNLSTRKAPEVRT